MLVLLLGFCDQREVMPWESGLQVSETSRCPVASKVFFQAIEALKKFNRSCFAVCETYLNRSVEDTYPEFLFHEAPANDGPGDSSWQ